MTDGAGGRMILGFACANGKVVGCIGFVPLLSFEIRMANLIRLEFFVAELGGITSLGGRTPCCTNCGPILSCIVFKKYPKPLAYYLV